jgi:hypothetical protein
VSIKELNLRWNDEIEKKINFKNLSRLKCSNKKKEDKILYVNIMNEDEIVKKKKKSIPKSIQNKIK